MTQEGRLPNGNFAPGNQIGKATQVKPGQVLNPKGRPKNVGHSIKEEMNNLQEATREELEILVNDEKTPAKKAVAAFRLLGAMGEGKKAREETETVLNHTDGKPTQTVRVEEVDLRTTTDKVGELLTEIRNKHNIQGDVINQTAMEADANDSD